MTRAGSILILLGFFLPAASCSTFLAKVSYSTSDLARQQSFLYMVLLGALCAILATWIPARDKAQEFWLLMGQVAGLALGALSFVWTMFMLSSELSELGMSLNPELGFFVLLLGYGLAGVGIFMGLAALGRAGPRAVPAAPRVREASPPVYEPQRGSAGARLELVRGHAPSSVSIRSADFQIGRSQRNDLVLSDTVVSALHARLRHARDAWFIQDQKSSNGTFVNGRQITAQRLNDGDEIRLGGTVFIFRI
jgi:hypothetical protein